MPNQVFRSSVRLIEGTRVEAEARGFKVTVDEPEQIGGSNQGMTPVELLLSSLGSCLSITISLFSKPFHVDIQELRLDVEGELDPMAAMGQSEARSGYQDIRVNVHIVSDAPISRIEKLIKMAESKCPVSDTLRVGVTINNNVELETATA
ncbi:OsmC family protein [Tepidibacillus marianensis]|uniref:OsmC family protein n=1 Tax=Tepidibacillus marianensis TaxID=3131995 RepID=UPI0030D5873F